MASKRHLRRKACEGKKRHDSQDHAILAIKIMHAKGMIHGIVKPYHCPHCGFYHVGHQGNGIYQRKRKLY